jgi:hypothetical protein
VRDPPEINASLAAMEGADESGARKQGARGANGSGAAAARGAEAAPARRAGGSPLAGFGAAPGKVPRLAYLDVNNPTHRPLARDWSARVAASRVAEVAAGRAAAFGLFAAAASETLLRQSVLSQLVGRWEGATRVEAASPTARAAFCVLPPSACSPRPRPRRSPRRR